MDNLDSALSTWQGQTLLSNMTNCNVRHRLQLAAQFCSYFYPHLSVTEELLLQWCHSFLAVSLEHSFLPGCRVLMWFMHKISLQQHSRWNRSKTTRAGEVGALVLKFRAYPADMWELLHILFVCVSVCACVRIWVSDTLSYRPHTCHPHNSYLAAIGLTHLAGWRTLRFMTLLWK